MEHGNATIKFCYDCLMEPGAMDSEPTDVLVML